MAFIAVAYLITDNYAPANIVLLNAILGPERVSTQWHFWFIEILVYLLLAATALLAIPWADRAERRFPLLFPLVLTGVGLLTRYELVNPGVPHTAPALWLFALGWAIARSRTIAQRCIVSAIAVLTVPGFFENQGREATLLAGVLLLIWLPSIPVPTVLRRLTLVLASASLYAYLVHWVVYPPLAGISTALAVAVSLAVGVAYWALCMRVMGSVSRRRTGSAGRSSRARSQRQARLLPRNATTSGRMERQ
jgi:heme exporter protein D